MPVVVAAEPLEPNVVIELAGGRVLRLQPPVSPQWLAELVHALEAQVSR